MVKKEIELALAKPGSIVQVKRFSGGIGLKTRLQEMGINQETQFKVIRNDGWGPVLINLGGNRLALGRQMTGKIMVENVNKV